MRHFITIAAVLSTGIALAQTPNGQPPGAGARSGAESIQPRLNLTQQQKQAVNRGLSGEPSQNAAADLQMRVVTPHVMPKSVTEPVPETKWYEFAKLPDRVLMVDPKDRSIAEIILIPTTPATTGAAPSGPSGR